MTPSSDNHVTVQLTGASEDADTVFEALRATFESPGGSGSGERPHPKDSVRPIVWSEVFDTSSTRGTADPRPLKGEVSAELSGGYQAVGRLAEALRAVFSAEDEGSSSGDQETERNLRLKP